jgi:hypothetical protein
LILPIKKQLNLKNELIIAEKPLLPEKLPKFLGLQARKVDIIML